MTAAPPAVGRAVHVLPPDGTSPARARALLRAVLREAGLDALLDDALLLVTELVTNSVVHAGTVVELRVETGDDLLVEVGDSGPGSTPVTPTAPDPDHEGGRGLLLLDALADEWGTTRTRSGKTVWFRLCREEPLEPAPTPPPTPEALPAAEPVVPALGWLLTLPDDLEQRLSATQLLGELLHRLCDALAIDTAALLVESELDPDRWTPVAVRGVPPAADEVAALRTRAREARDRVAVEPGSTLLTLRGRGGVLGALVLGGDGLDGAAVAVARLAVERLSLVLRDERADLAQRRQRGSMSLLAEASDMFAATLDVQLAVTLAAQLVVPRFAQWSAVHTTSDQGPVLAAIGHEDEDGAVALRAVLSSADGGRFAERMVRDLAAQRPVLVGRAEVAGLLGDAPRGDVLALPLVARRRLLGSLLVARPAGTSYSAEDVTLLLDLARRAALAVDNARLYEERTSIAQALQASLLPAALPVDDAVDFGARYVAAGEGNEVGGDFYDVFTLPDGGWGIAIGDVCGKGAEAAAITGLARNVLRLLVREGRSPAQALRRLNEAVLELGDRGRFCTAALAVVRPSTGRPGGLDLAFCGAGHPLPVRLTAQGEAAFAGGSGTLLGVVEDPDLVDEQLVLEPGDALVLYTDGVTERRRGRELYGDQTLLAVLRDAAGQSADAVAGALERSVRSYAPEASRDDLAVLVVRAPGSA